jgi:hypothetical protein
MEGDMKRSAELSTCGKYRWWLRRRWSDGPIVCFVMLNPSTADAEKDDPTITRCIAFAKAWGFGALSVRNLYPWRATDPKDLTRAIKRGLDVRGGERGLAELAAAGSADLVIAAWGAYRCSDRAGQFLQLMQAKPVWCLAATKNGDPAHPLYLAADLLPRSYYGCAGHVWTDGLTLEVTHAAD